MPGIIDNKQTKLSEVLKDALEDGNLNRLRISVGYFFTSGLRSVMPELKEFIEQGGQVDILMGNSVNRQTYEDLVRTYKDTGIAESRQATHVISQEEKEELERETNQDLKQQVLFMTPSIENDEFLSELSEWISEEKLRLRIYPKERFHAKAYVFESEGDGILRPDMAGIVGSSNLTFSGLTSNTELNAPVYTADAEELQKWFEEKWEESEEFSEKFLDVINNSWASDAPGQFPPPYYVYIKAIFEMFKESLETTEEILRSFQVYQELYEFQKWAVLRACKIAMKYNGVMVSDVVGMGKTFVGLAILEHFYHRNYMMGKQGKILIICPKKLKTMWENMVAKFSLKADVISMGMLSNEDYDKELLQKHGNATVALIDESHHFRNTGTNRYDNVSQYLPLVNEVILLSATPYTKGADDLYNQIKLFHLEDETKIPITPPKLDDFMKKVKDDQANLSELLSHIMVRRTRYDIVNQYGGEDEEGREYIEMGGERKYLPERKLRTRDYSVEDVYGEGFYQEIVDVLVNLTYARYSLGTEDYLKPEYREERKYQDLSTMGRNLRGLMKQLMLKRLESSIFAFKETLRKMVKSYENFHGLLKKGEIAIGEDIDELLKGEEDLERIRDQIEAKREEGEVKTYDVNAFHVDKLEEDLHQDLDDLKGLYDTIDSICKEVKKDYSKDEKLKGLKDLLNSIYKGEHDVIRENTDSKKVIVFSQYADTIEHLERGLKWMKDKGELTNVKLETVTGDTSNVDGISEKFAPKSNQAEEKYTQDQQIDLLVATDVMSEGLNLQDANFVINYDIHWNPLKLIQRIGRVDRLGTEHETIYAFNFLPETGLEEELGIVERVKKRINEINDVMGTDARILTRDEEPNRHYMKAIYEENMDKLEKYEQDVLIGQDSISGSVNKIRELKNKDPELFDKVTKMDGIRSAKEWGKEHDAVFVLCSAGDYATPYLVSFPEGEPEILTSDQEEILGHIESEEEEKPAEVSEEKFKHKYAKAASLARKQFKEEVKQRERFARIKKSKYRDYVERELRKFSDTIEDPEQRKAIARYREILHNINIDPVLGDFKKFAENNLKGEKLFKAARELIGKYNLEDKYEKKKEWKERLNQPPHVLCGMYLKGSSSGEDK
ncbi:MAG: helicase-related protein [Thermoproteota archaeon]